MPVTTAQQVFKDLEANTWKPFYLIHGEEPFQMGEVLQKLKKFFIQDETGGTFNYEVFDGEGLDSSALLASLEMLPGLFGGDSLRLVVCQRFEKATASASEILESYFKNPLETTCFVLTATKVDKRKSWYKQVEKQGAVIEVSEPYDREWPKWHGYFEKKIGKKIEADAWEMLLESSGRMLSVLWMEVQKAATFVGEMDSIRGKEMSQLISSGGLSDIFAFAEDVVCRRQLDAVSKYQNLLLSGENEIKLLSILVRQFRMVDQCLGLMKKGITDSKTIAPQIGAHPFFVSKIISQTKFHSPKSLGHALDLLSECDFRMKTGEGSLFENFLVPYLHR